MKLLMTRFIFCILLLLLHFPSDAQQLYTRKAKLEDFPTKTLKVLASGTSLLELSLREEMSSRWRISPFEFCTPEEYQELHEDSSYYFLELGTLEGIAFLTLSKGGKEDDSNNFARPFEVVRIPIASTGDPSGRELMYMGAFVEIIQKFVYEAMESEQTAYSGLKACNNKKLSGKRVYLNSEEADAIYEAGTPDTVVGIVIAPTLVSFDSYCYKMLIAPDTYELFYFKQDRYKGSNDAAFSKSEIKKFEKRNGIIHK